MTNRFLYRAVIVGLLTCGVAAIAPGTARADDDDDDVTIVGCFLRTTDDDGDHVRYVLANSKLGAATAVADQNCTAIAGTELIKLKDVDDSGLDQMASGRWVELFGELEPANPEHGHDSARFEVKSFREVLLAPRITYAPPAPVIEAPAPEPVAAAPEPAPVATAGIEPKALPKTASPLPLIAMLGLCALGGGLVLGAFGRRRDLGRG